MSRLRTAGIYLRTKPIHLRHDDGQEMLDNDGRKIWHDEIERVSNLFRKWREAESSI